MYRHAHTRKTSADPAASKRPLPARLGWIDATAPTPGPSPTWHPTGHQTAADPEPEENTMSDILALLVAVLDTTSSPNRMESPA